MVGMSRSSILSAGVAAGLVYHGVNTFVGVKSTGAPALRGVRSAAAQTPASTSGAASPSGTGLTAACSFGAFLVAAGVARRTATARAAAKKEELAETIPRPEDLLESPKFPLFMGGTGGYMSKATKERHAITWTSKEEYFIEMPTGGRAIMNKGENLCYFRKKEQCLALGKQLKTMKIENFKIYRLAKDGTVTFMHPADGVFPEKVNPGRVQVNGRPFSIGNNPQPGDLKWTKYHQRPYEADALTTLFVKARLVAWGDQENLFPMPQPTDFVDMRENAPEYWEELMAAEKEWQKTPGSVPGSM